MNKIAEILAAEQRARDDERQRIIDRYGDFNNGCDCCSDSDLKTEIERESARLPNNK